jgi:hypothetical protein
MEGWKMDNGAAIGYMILAAKRLDIPEKLIKDLEHAMYEKMDFVDEERAEQEYQNF